MYNGINYTHKNYIKYIYTKKCHQVNIKKKELNGRPFIQIWKKKKLIKNLNINLHRFN